MLLGLFGFFLLSSLPASAATFQCELLSRSLTTPELKRSFSLEQATEQKLPDFSLLHLERHQGRTSIVIKQVYGTNKADSLSYELSCSDELNCQGRRVSSVSGQEKAQAFAIHPGTEAVAQIGQRDIFRYSATGKSFKAQFIQYEISRGGEAGTTVSCHE